MLLISKRQVLLGVGTKQHRWKKLKMLNYKIQTISELKLSKIQVLNKGNMVNKVTQNIIFNFFFLYFLFVSAGETTLWGYGVFSRIHFKVILQFWIHTTVDSWPVLNSGENAKGKFYGVSEISLDPSNNCKFQLILTKLTHKWRTGDEKSAGGHLNLLTNDVSLAWVKSKQSRGEWAKLGL